MEKEMATHSGTLAWNIPRMEKPGRLQSIGPQSVGHDWATSLLSKCLLNQAIKRGSHWIIIRKSFLANRPHQVPLRYRHWFYLMKLKICVLSWGPRGTIFVSSEPFSPLLASCLHIPFLPKISGDLRLNPRTKSKVPFLACRIFIFRLWNTFLCFQLPLYLSLIKFSDSQTQARPFYCPTMTLNINPPKKEIRGGWRKKEKASLVFWGIFCLVWLVGWGFFIFCFVLPQCVASGILAPRPGIEPGSSTIRVWIPNHWTTGEFPTLIKYICCSVSMGDRF